MQWLVDILTSNNFIKIAQVAFFFVITGAVLTKLEI